jgi:hypothetical protein
MSRSSNQLTYGTVDKAHSTHLSSCSLCIFSKTKKPITSRRLGQKRTVPRWRKKKAYNVDSLVCVNSPKILVIN